MTKRNTRRAKAPVTTEPTAHDLAVAWLFLHRRGGEGTINPDGSVTAHTDRANIGAAVTELAKRGKVTITDQRVRIVACL